MLRGHLDPSDIRMQGLAGKSSPLLRKNDDHAQQL